MKIRREPMAYTALVKFKPPRRKSDCFISEISIVIECNEPFKTMDFLDDFLKSKFPGVEITEKILR